MCSSRITCGHDDRRAVKETYGVMPLFDALEEKRKEDPEQHPEAPKRFD